jgi:O-antigen ligase
LFLWAFWKDSQGGPSEWIKVVGSPIFLVKNDVTWFSLVAPLSLALVYQKPRSVSGVTAFLSVVGSIVVVGMFQSRVALLIMVVTLTCFFSCVHSKKMGLALGSAILLLIVGIDGLAGFKLLERVVQHWDGSGRIPLWLSAWEMFLDSPLLGHGPHTFVLLYQPYLQDLSLPSWLFVDPRLIPWPHNLYLEVLAEQGIVGFLTLLLLLKCGITLAWQLRTAPSREVKLLGYGAFASLVGFCLAATVELTLMRHWVVLMLFSLLGVVAQLSLLIYNPKK